MIIRMHVRDDRTPEGWWETTSANDGEDPMKCAQRTVAYFNQTLRGGELPRTVISAQVSEEEDTKHRWTKSNLVTIIKSNSMYDTYTCQRCGAKGKRFNLSEMVVPNRQGQRLCKLGAKEKQ